MSGFTFAIEMDMKSNSDTISKKQKRAKIKSCPVHHQPSKIKYTSEHATPEILQKVDTDQDRKSEKVVPPAPLISDDEKRVTVSIAIKKLIADMLVGSIENFVVKKDPDLSSQTMAQPSSNLFSPTLKNLSSGQATIEPDPPGLHPSLSSEQNA